MTMHDPKLCPVCRALLETRRARIIAVSEQAIREVRAMTERNLRRIAEMSK